MNNYQKLIVVLFLLVGLHANSSAQYFVGGQDPASIKWKQINTNDFQIIFPEEYEEKAKYMAVIFQDLLSIGGKDLKHKPKKFSVVVHTHSSESNGMVAWAPKRVEIFSTSSPDNDSQLWIDHVATHEYRHVIQIDKLEQGFTRFLNFVFGQQATMVVLGLYLPPWFLEGDAVCMETALSQSGRGRQAFFEQELRAQLLEKGNYSYDKAVNGSYKDYVTDRYKLGYYLVGKARSNYGDALWEHALNRIANRPFGISPFSKGIKIGMLANRDSVYKNLSQKQMKLAAEGVRVGEFDWEIIKKKNTRADGKLMLYYDIMKELQWEWGVQDAKLKSSNCNYLTEREKIYTNRRFPHVTDRGELVVVKEGLANATCFEIIKEDGSTEKLATPGYGLTTGFDYKNGKLVWSERKSHLRWENADKNVLVVYDLETKKRNTIKLTSNLFSPVFSDDAKSIVAVESDKLGDNYLVLIDVASRKVKQRFSVGNNEFIQSPKWKDEKSIVYILLNRNGKHLVEFNLTTEQRKVLMNFGKKNISQLEVTENHLFFTADFTGQDNIFAYDFLNGKVYQVTHSRFGASDSHVKSNQIFYSDYTADGYLPAKTDVNKQDWKEWQKKYHSYSLADQLSDQIGVNLSPDTTNLEQFEVKNYSKTGHLFNIHSWAPIFIDGLERKTDIGISVASQNKLSTLLATVGYKKEEGYQNGLFYANLSYRAWFPIIDTKLTVGDRNYKAKLLANRISPPQVDTLLVDRKVKQWVWENSIRFPFNLSSGQFTTSITPKISYDIVKLTDIETTPIGIYTSNPNPSLGKYNFDKDLSLEVLDYQLFAYNIAKMAPRDIQYQWAQIVELNYRHTPFGDKDLGHTWSAEGHLYFPGFMKHHGLKMYAGYQLLNNSLFSNMIKSPRGMTNLRGKDVFTAGVDYAFPLCYPDWSIGPIAYFKRIKMNLFMDYGYEGHKRFVSNNQIIETSSGLASFGADLRADLHCLRFPTPFDLGVRVGYEEQSKGVFAKLLLSFNLNSF